jgi:hypothetical protein
VSAQANIDNDTANQSWGYVKPLPTTTAGVAGGGCLASGVYNATTGAQDMLDIVGPCDATSGQSVF